MSSTATATQMTVAATEDTFVPNNFYKNGGVVIDYNGAQITLAFGKSFAQNIINSHGPKILEQADMKLHILSIDKKDKDPKLTKLLKNEGKTEIDVAFTAEEFLPLLANVITGETKRPSGKFDKASSVTWFVIEGDTVFRVELAKIPTTNRWVLDCNPLGFGNSVKGPKPSFVMKVE